MFGTKKTSLHQINFNEEFSYNWTLKSHLITQISHWIITEESTNLDVSILPKNLQLEILERLERMENMIKLLEADDIYFKGCITVNRKNIHWDKSNLHVYLEKTFLKNLDNLNPLNAMAAATYLCMEPVMNNLYQNHKELRKTFLTDATPIIRQFWLTIKKRRTNNMLLFIHCCVNSLLQGNYHPAKFFWDYLHADIQEDFKNEYFPILSRYFLKNPKLTYENLRVFMFVWSELKESQREIFGEKTLDYLIRAVGAQCSPLYFTKVLKLLLENYSFPLRKAVAVALDSYKCLCVSCDANLLPFRPVCPYRRKHLALAAVKEVFKRNTLDQKELMKIFGEISKFYCRFGCNIDDALIEAIIESNLFKLSVEEYNRIHNLKLRRLDNPLFVKFKECEKNPGKFNRRYLLYLAAWSYRRLLGNTSL